MEADRRYRYYEASVICIITHHTYQLTDFALRPSVESVSHEIILRCYLKINAVAPFIL